MITEEYREMVRQSSMSEFFQKQEDKRKELITNAPEAETVSPVTQSSHIPQPASPVGDVDE